MHASSWVASGEVSISLADAHAFRLDRPAWYGDERLPIVVTDSECT